MKIIVTGIGGQLGYSISQLANEYPQHEFLFPSLEEFNLANDDQITEYIAAQRPQLFINCAAYTAVDKAETEQALALQINGKAVGTIAAACRKCQSRLIQIRSDYVFNGRNSSPYLPAQPTDPVNYYGYSKLVGEQTALTENAGLSIVIRTAWVYSHVGHNFVKTMRRLMRERSEISVVADQVGSPTYALDLARACIVAGLDAAFPAGIYHFTNEGTISWHEFAEAIKDISGYHCTVKPIGSDQFPTPAKRPSYSVLDCTLTEETFFVQRPAWRSSLEHCIRLLQQAENER